jgi:hypothetical protein
MIFPRSFFLLSKHKRGNIIQIESSMFQLPGSSEIPIKQFLDIMRKMKNIFKASIDMPLPGTWNMEVGTRARSECS